MGQQVIMKYLTAAVLCVAFSLGLAGCSDDSSKSSSSSSAPTIATTANQQPEEHSNPIVGTWEAIGFIDEESGEFIEMSNYSSFSFEFASNGKFSERYDGIGEEASDAGTWAPINGAEGAYMVTYSNGNKLTVVVDYFPDFEQDLHVHEIDDALCVYVKA